MDTIYSSLLQRTLLPQPSIQRFAVISIFQKIQSSSNSDSDPGLNAISQCLHSDSTHVVDQTVREICRHVKDGFMDFSRGLLELQSALEGCDSKFVDLFVKGISFLVNFAFQKKILVVGGSYESHHPFIRVLSCRIEVQSELVQQVLLFIVRNRVVVGFVQVCEFLKPFLNFSILRIPFSDHSSSSSSFAKQLVSSIASLCCSFPSEALPIFKLLMGCLKLFPCKNAIDCKDVVYVAEYMVDAYIVVMKTVVETGLMTNEIQLCGVELLGSLLSLCTDLNKHLSAKAPIVELSKRILVVQRELGLQFLPELSSVLISLSLILNQADFEHEQLCILKLSLFVLQWKRENARFVVESNCGFSEELLLIFPVMNHVSSPSRSVKATAIDLLSILEKILMFGPKRMPNFQELSQSISKPESIASRLLQYLWFQDQASPSFSYFLHVAATVKSDIEEINSDQKSWMSQLKAYSFMLVDRQKSPMSLLQENLVTDIPFLLASVVSILVMHHSEARNAIGSLAAVGLMDPKLALPMLFSVLFYNKIFLSHQRNSQEIVLELLEMLPSLASHSAMIPFVVQTIVPMLQRDIKPVLRATATRILCKTWEVTDRVFGSLQGILQQKAFQEFVYEKDIFISMAASVHDVCRKNPDRGVDLILSVSACIESQDPTVKALGLQSLAHLCEADVVDFYTAWDVIAKHVMDYSTDPIVAHSLCILLRWGALDAEAYAEASKRTLQILWEVGTSSRPTVGCKWTKARTSAFESLTQYEVEHIKKNISDFSERNLEMLISEVNPDVLRAMEQLQAKIITFEHTNRRRLLKEKRVAVNKVEKLLDVFPQLIFRSGIRTRKANELPGASLLCRAFNPKELSSMGKAEELPKLHGAYENALVEIADSLQLSRNILVALLSLQSWKQFLQRWMRSALMYHDGKSPSSVLDKSANAADDILKIMRRNAEGSLPRSAENIALSIGALCMVLPPSAHTTTTSASKFLLKWLYQHEHEYRQWSSAIVLGLVSSCLHATDRKQKIQIVTGLLKVACDSKSSLVKGACMVGLGFASQDLLTRIEASDSHNTEETGDLTEINLLGKIIRGFSLRLSQLSPSSANALKSLCKYVSMDTDDVDTEIGSLFPCDDSTYLEEDVWGAAGVIVGLGNSVTAIYRAGGQDSVIKMKALLTSWIPHVNPAVQSFSVRTESETLLSVGSCLALPTVVSFCQKVELIDKDEINHLVTGYRELISELVSVKKSGIFHQSLLMASCIGAGSLLSCILDEGVHSISTNDVKSVLELFQKCYSNPYPSTVHFGGMLGVVNALGAGAGSLTQISSKPSTLPTGHREMEASYIRGPILSNPVCEPLSTALMQEMFLVAQDSKDQQLQKYASWAISFLRQRWCSRERNLVKDSSGNKEMQSKPVSQSFSEDTVVWQLSTWLRDICYLEEGLNAHVSTVETVLRCLSLAPRLPSLDWGAIIRRCMRYEDQVSAKLSPDQALKTGTLREECLQFAFAHANQIDPLLYFLDELSDLSRFRTLELNLQTHLLCHLEDLIKIFSGSRLEKLFDDVTDYFSSSSSSYHIYDSNQKSMLRVSFWKGMHGCLNEASNDSSEYTENMEKCMESLFSLLPALHFNSSQREDQANSVKEWSDAIRCMGRARRDWLMDMLEVSEWSQIQRGCSNDIVKRIQAKAKLVMTGCIPLIELGKLKSYMLNTDLDGIWDALVEVVAALQCANGSTRRQWLIDATEISCITRYPSTALQFIGLLSSSCCKYMPLLIIDRATVLNDLPVTLPSLLSNSSWKVVAEPVVQNLWTSTERVYEWAKCLETSGAGNDTIGQQQHPIDRSESAMAAFMTRLLHATSMSLKDHLPLDKQLKLTNMVVP